MKLTERGFTLVELMVVMVMILMIIAALAVSLSGAQERARRQKALSEVKIIAQAILAYENYDRKHELPTMTDAEANASSLGFILGDAGTGATGYQVPGLLMAALSGGQTVRDPWGRPYRVTIREADASVVIGSATGNMQTGYMMPNLYRLTEEERK